MPSSFIFLEALGEGIEFEHAVNRLGRVILHVQGCVEDREHCVADELVDCAIVFLDGAGHAVEILVEEAPDVARIESFRHRREIGDVGEEERHLAPLAAERQLGRIVDQLLHKIRRNIERECVVDEFALAACIETGHGIDRGERTGNREAGCNESDQDSEAFIEHERADRP